MKFQQDADHAVWLDRLEQGRIGSPKKLLRSFLTEFGFTHSLANEISVQCNMDQIRMEAMSKDRKEKLAKYLSGAPLTIARLCPMEKAMAMRGGVSLKEICPDTMESRLIKGLYFAGELVDLVGPCGGYNIQFAFSSGRLAGLS